MDLRSRSMISFSMVGDCLGMDSLRSATTITVPARSGSRIAICARASAVNTNVTARRIRNPRFGNGQTNHATPSGTNSSSQTGWKKEIMNRAKTADELPPLEVGGWTLDVGYFPSSASPFPDRHQAKVQGQNTERREREDPGHRRLFEPFFTFRRPVSPL